MNKKLSNIDKILLAGTAVLFFWKIAEQRMTNIQAKTDFVNKMLKIAKGIQTSHGIAPVITVTQAAHESRWGDSELTRLAYNLFGFTGESWEKLSKPVLYMRTKEFIGGLWVTVSRPFRKYGSWEESVQDWANTISTLSRYRTAYEKAKIGIVNDYAIEIKRAGYATDPDYTPKLIAVSKSVLALNPNV